MSEDRPGLKAVYQSREDRLRNKGTRLTPNLLLSLLTAVVVIILGYRYFAGRQLDEQKAALLAKQHAVLATLGKEWFPLRDRIEKLTLEAAARYDGDFVDTTAGRWDFRAEPGIYLRVRVAEAKDADSLRKAAAGSLRDSFVGCLLREPNAAAKGEPDAGAFPEQPWNLAKAYDSTRILTDDWGNEVKDASDPLRLRVFEQQYDEDVRDKIPGAVDIVKNAQFFLLVLDEDDPAAVGEGGAPPTEQSLQSVAHPARVFVFKLPEGGAIVRLRRSAEASFVFAGERPVTDPETLEAMKRQVNNCALAQAVQAAIKDGGS